MIQPLEGADCYRAEDVAAKVNEVIAVVNRLLGAEVEIVAPVPGSPDVVSVRRGRLVLGEEDK